MVRGKFNLKFAFAIFAAMVFLTSFAGAKILINEVLVNGVNDPDSEWIELYNDGDKIADLDSWSLWETSSKNFTFNATIQAKGFLLLVSNAEEFGQNYPQYKLDNTNYLEIDVSNFNLADSSGEIRIYGQNGAVEDFLGYHQISGKSYENISIGRMPDGSDKFQNFSELTPGFENPIVEEENDEKEEIVKTGIAVMEAYAEINGVREELFDKGTISEKPMPGSVLKLKVEIQNLFDEKSGVDLEDIDAKAVIENIDDGKDISEWFNDFDLKAGEDKTLSLVFAIPSNAKTGKYNLVISASGFDSKAKNYKASMKSRLEIGPIDGQKTQELLSASFANPEIIESKELSFDSPVQAQTETKQEPQVVYREVMRECPAQEAEKEISYNPAQNQKSEDDIYKMMIYMAGFVIVMFLGFSFITIHLTRVR